MYQPYRNQNRQPFRAEDAKRKPEEEAKRKAEEFWTNKLKFDSKWITDEATESLVLFAEKAGEFMADKKLTNAKIRNVYGEIKRIQTGGFDNLKASFFLLKPKMAYAVGRDKENIGLLLFQRIFNECFTLIKSKEHYQNFCNLIEAILAYHKAFGGKE